MNNVNKDNLYTFNRLIGYNDDNHGTELFLNGEHMGNLDEEICTIGNVMDAMKELLPTLDTRVNLIDLEEYGLTGDEADSVHDFFCKFPVLTAEQEVAILNEDYKSLVKII